MATKQRKKHLTTQKDEMCKKKNQKHLISLNISYIKPNSTLNPLIVFILCYYCFLSYTCRDFLTVVLGQSQLLGPSRQRSAEEVWEVPNGSEYEYYQQKKCYNYIWLWIISCWTMLKLTTYPKLKKGVTAVTVYRPVDGVLPDHCLIRRLDSLQLTLRWSTYIKLLDMIF